MIFIHLLIGIILGRLFGNSLFFIAGSILPDIDHLFIIIKNKMYNMKKIVNSIKFEKDFNINYKTPLLHSILGLVLFTIIVYFINNTRTLYFSIVYFLYLSIDWTDIDDKYFLYPLKIKFKGHLPIWSKFEQILTIILILTIIVLYII